MPAPAARREQKIEQENRRVIPQARVPPKISARCVIDTGFTLSHTGSPATALATSTASSKA